MKCPVRIDSVQAEVSTGHANYLITIRPETAPEIRKQRWWIEAENTDTGGQRVLKGGGAQSVEDIFQALRMVVNGQKWDW